MDQILPGWVLVVGFLLTVGLTVLRVRDALRLGRLHVRLTREVFFRLTDKGESLFANAVLLVRNGPIEIRSVTFRLSRVSSSQKTYSLEPLWFGERVQTPDNVFAEHHFSSRSPLELIPADTGKRALYWALLQEYGSGIEASFRELRREAVEIRRFVEPYVGQAPTNADEAQNLRSELHERIATVQRKLVTDVMQRLQLEEGDYELKMGVSYRRIGAWSTQKMAESGISFTVGKDVRELLQWSLEEFARSIVMNTVTDGRAPMSPNPEYAPLKVKEAEHS